MIYNIYLIDNNYKNSYIEYFNNCTCKFEKITDINSIECKKFISELVILYFNKHKIFNSTIIIKPVIKNIKTFDTLFKFIIDCNILNDIYNIKQSIINDHIIKYTYDTAK